MQEILLVNPRKRGSKKRRSRRSARRHNPRRGRSHSVARSRKRFMRSRRRRNPSGRMLSVAGLKSSLMPAVWGGTGAVLTDIAYRMIPVPGALAILKGPLSPVSKIAVAFGVAQIGKMVVGANAARDMLSGSLAVIAYGLINQFVLSRIPVVSAPVAGYELSGNLGYNSPGEMVTGTGRALVTESVDEYVSGMGEYVSGYELSGG
jgi:hypothetical protein